LDDDFSDLATTEKKTPTHSLYLNLRAYGISIALQLPSQGAGFRELRPDYRHGLGQLGPEVGTQASKIQQDESAKGKISRERR